MTKPAVTPTVDGDGNSIHVKRRRGPGRRGWIGIAVAAVVVSGAAVGVPTVLHAVEHQEATDAFEVAVSDRAAAYELQEKAIEQLHTLEDLVTATYPQYLAIGMTLTNSTVADPALRADLLTKTSELATTALALDETGALDAERPYLFTALIPAEDLPLEGITPPAQTEDVNTLTRELIEDAEAVAKYVDLVGGITDDIIDASDAVAVSADVAIASAGEKGITLTWEKAPAETAAVVAAATALTADGASNLPLEERAALVGTYIAAVNAAGAAHQAVLDREAEAARQAEAERQAAAQRQQWNNNRGGGNGNPSSEASRGGQPKNNTNGSSGSIPQGGGRPGGGTNGTNGGCWTSNGVGGTMPCSG